jgi:predicted esterase
MALNLRSAGPHHGQPIRQAGAPLGRGRAVGILLHGRGASAEDILELTDGLHADGITWLAPQAAGHTWYPNRFIAPIESNEPWLTSALDAVGDVVAQAVTASAPTSEATSRILLGGFSQGACLALEFVVRTPARYGAVAGLSGGLIGPPGTVWPQSGSLDGTPVFLGCSDVDFHIPKERVMESAAVLRARGAQVTAVLYPNMDHTVNEDEMIHLQALVDGLLA